MSKNYSLLDLLFIIVLYLTAWWGGYKHGEYFVKKRIESNAKEKIEEYRTHLDSLVADLQFVKHSSDSAKQAIISREIEYLNRYIKARLND